LRVDGNPLAPSTKAKIRNLMSVLFNHAIRHEWLEPEELSALLSQLDRCDLQFLRTQRHLPFALHNGEVQFSLTYWDKSSRALQEP
jgi:hypothetical protein